MTDRLKAGRPVFGDVPQDLLRRVTRANRRRECIAVGPPWSGRELPAGNAWDSRGYGLQWPAAVGGGEDGEPAAFSIWGQASRDHPELEITLLLSGVYRVELLEEDATHTELRSRSILGEVVVDVTGRQTQAGSETLGEVLSCSRSRPLHYVYTNRGARSHYLYNRHWQGRRRVGSQDDFAYREGLLAVPGVDVGVWEPATERLELVGAGPDWRQPIRFDVVISIKHPGPEFLDDDLAASAPRDPTNPAIPAAGPMAVDVLGCAIWSP